MQGAYIVNNCKQSISFTGPNGIEYICTSTPGVGMIRLSPLQGVKTSGITGIANFQNVS